MTEDGINIDVQPVATPLGETEPADVSTDEAPALADLEQTATDDVSASTEDVRAHLMGQFERWLDGMLAGESAPPVPEELIAEALAESEEPDASNTDLYTLFAAMTKLSGEIGLQGRSFKQLADSLAPVAQLPGAIEAMEEAQHAAGRQFDRLAEQLQPQDDDAGLPASKEVLAVLFDLLERLERGMKTFEDGIASIKNNQPSGFLARLCGAQRQSADTLQTLQAMHDGYRMTFSRLQGSLEQWNVQRVGHEGDPFDPAIMTAIEIDTTGSHPEGTVAGVYRNGYVHHGRMLATAQVKVAKQS